ncbi:putative serine/threonine-protein kinase [Apostasia shenzhenica]|uniref:[RNA-polymerase]-subunit kinase n=1 Tax=Apostasia shenzhenica TaxID=1088818 RepID=A0A2I0B9L7_9ASPA|nr:putative serine/threonine-protein kinase [Apostasia shenzhenica]
MGCVCGKPSAIEDSREIPRARQSVAPAKLSVSSSRREDMVAVRGASISVEERKQGNRPVRANGEVGERRERQVYPSHQHSPQIGSIPKAIEGEQVAAGWPAWLAAVAGEAIRGWVPRRADSFERLDKVTKSRAYKFGWKGRDCSRIDLDLINLRQVKIMALLQRKGENLMIGQGTYSNVYRARDLENGMIVALKKVSFDSLEPESVRFMAREIYILRRLDHPNIINLEGLVTSHMSCSLYLVFEYMDHDLAGLSSFPDFGLASFFDPHQSQPLTSRVVTLWYRPPELLLGATNYGVAVDLWSTGCILAELYAGKPIMPGRTEVEQLHKIFKLCGSPSDEYWRKSKLPHATIFKPQHPYRRCVAETYKDFPAPALTLVEVLLSIDPADRGTAASALNSEFFAAKPHACDPSTLPRYPPSKEFDTKVRDEQARRQHAAGNKAQRPDLERMGQRESKAFAAPEANAELSMSMKKWHEQSSSKSRSEKFNPHQEEAASGFPLEPPRLNPALEAPKRSHGHYSHRSSHSGPLVNQGQWAKATRRGDDALKKSSTANLSALSNLMASRRNSLMDGSERNGSQLELAAPSGRFSDSQNDRADRKVGHLYRGGSQRKENDTNSRMEHSISHDFGAKGNNIHYSGPLLRSSGNVEEMLKDHDRQIQELFRRAKMDKSKARKAHGGNPTGATIKPYNVGVVPIYPSSRSSIVFTSSRAAMQQQHLWKPKAPGLFVDMEVPRSTMEEKGVDNEGDGMASPPLLPATEEADTAKKARIANTKQIFTLPFRKV